VVTHSHLVRLLIFESEVERDHRRVLIDSIACLDRSLSGGGTSG